MAHTIIIFGATGDLAREKLFPSLMRLYHDGGLLPDTRIIGFSRRTWNDEEFRTHIKPYLSKVATPQEVEEFLKFISYHEGTFDGVESYTALYKKVSGPALLHLSVSPDNYDTVLKTLRESELHKIFENEESKLLIEKPFGLDHSSAELLDTHLRTVCSEKQIYRIDHYLAKPQVLAIFHQKPDLNNCTAIHIRLFESKDIGTRGASYDHVGALIDVGQNHLLQMLATVIMDTSRAEALKSLEFVSLIRGQYKGYREHKGVAPDSNTETYFKLILKSHKKNLKDTEIILEAGKAMDRSCSDIELVFKDGHREQLKDPAKGGKAPYEQLFFDALRNNDELFPSFQEILASWNIIDTAKRHTQKLYTIY